MILRALSALVLAPLLILLLLEGSRLALFVVLMMVAPVLLWEWMRLKEPVTLVGFVLMLVGAWWLMWTGFLGHMGWIPLEIGMILLIFMAWSLVEFQPGKVVSSLVGFRFMGVLYCAMPLLVLDGIRARPQGGWLICLLMFVIWATDTGAYLVGRTWGKRKLVPVISPNKTWAGFWGGTLLGTLVGVGIVLLFGSLFSWQEGLLLALLLSLAGQIGDLVVSLLKREVGVKDTGNLIPGHGGLLDRLDSLLFAIPTFAFYLHWHSSDSTMGAWILGG